MDSSFVLAGDTETDLEAPRLSRRFPCIFYFVFCSHWDSTSRWIVLCSRIEQIVCFAIFLICLRCIFREQTYPDLNKHL